MPRYRDATEPHANLYVGVNPAGDGMADVSVEMKTKSGACDLELISRVDREDLPNLIGDLLQCMEPEDRTAYLAAKLGSA